jgi:hypothetical protein
VPCPNLTATSDHARLAGEMRTTQFALDDLAAEVGADRDTPDQLNELADRLEQMTQVLRLRAGTRTIHAALEQP